MVDIQIEYGPSQEEIQTAIAAVVRSLIDEVSRHERYAQPGASLAGALSRLWQEAAGDGQTFAAHTGRVLADLQMRLRETEEAARKAQATLENTRTGQRRLWEREKAAHARTRQRLAGLEASLDVQRVRALETERDGLRQQLQDSQARNAALREQSAALQTELSEQAQLIAAQQEQLNRLTCGAEWPA